MKVLKILSLTEKFLVLETRSSSRNSIYRKLWDWWQNSMIVQETLRLTGDNVKWRKVDFNSPPTSALTRPTKFLQQNAFLRGLIKKMAVKLQWRRRKLKSTTTVYCCITCIISLLSVSWAFHFGSSDISSGRAHTIFDGDSSPSYAVKSSHGKSGSQNMEWQVGSHISAKKSQNYLKKWRYERQMLGQTNSWPIPFKNPDKVRVDRLKSTLPHLTQNRAKQLSCQFVQHIFKSCLFHLTVDVTDKSISTTCFQNEIWFISNICRGVIWRK